MCVYVYVCVCSEGCITKVLANNFLILAEEMLAALYHGMHRTDRKRAEDDDVEDSGKLEGMYLRGDFGLVNRTKKDDLTRIRFAQQKPKAAFWRERKKTSRAFPPVFIKYEMYWPCVKVT